MNEVLAINLDANISDIGVCGNGADSHRCDEGQCCSKTGYCGPEYDGTGWINYDEDGYYASGEEALAAHCTNPLGDWRVLSCPQTQDSVSASSPIFLSVFFMKFLFIVTYLFCVV